MNESANLEVRILLEALISEREGMVAENKIRESRGYAMAYDDAAFCGNAEGMRKLVSQVKP